MLYIYILYIYINVLIKICIKINIFDSSFSQNSFLLECVITCQIDWKSMKWLFFDIYLSFFLVVLTHNVYCNRWHWHIYTSIFLFKRFYIIDLICFFTLYIYFLYCNFIFFDYVFLLLSLFIYYESIDLFRKKVIPLIDTF